MDTQKAPAMDTGIQQDVAQTAVSDPLAGDGSWIIWPAENDFSVLGPRDRGTSDVIGPGGLPCPPSDFSVIGRDRGTSDVIGPGGLPCPPSDFSVIGRDRGTSDVIGPGGSPTKTASLPTRRVKTPSR